MPAQLDQPAADFLRKVALDYHNEVQVSVPWRQIAEDDRTVDYD